MLIKNLKPKNTILKKVFLLAFLISLSTFAQDVIFEESFKEKKFSKRIQQSIWGESYSNTPKASFTFYKGRKDNSCLKVQITKSTTDKVVAKASIDFMSFAIKNKKEYKITFWVKSMKKTDLLSCTIFSHQKTGSKNYNFAPMFEKRIEFSSQGKWVKIEHTFTAKKKTGSDDPIDLKNLALGIGFNSRLGTFFIDDISIERI